MHRALAETIDSFAQGIEKSRRSEDRTLIRKYLSELAPLLARATLGHSILQEIEMIERLFGHTWVIEPQPFEEAFRRWRTFRSDYRTWALASLNVNERLRALGLAADFDEACRAKDERMVRHLLDKADVDEAAISAIVEKF